MAVRTTRITIQTESLLIAYAGQTVGTWCPECQTEVQALIVVDESFAAQLRAVVPLGAHVWNAQHGFTLVCLPSLSHGSRSGDVQKI